MTDKIKCILLGGGLLMAIIGLSAMEFLTENQSIDIVESVKHGTTKSDQRKQPTLTFYNAQSVGVCTDNSQLDAYDDLLLSFVEEAKDYTGKDIKDWEHISCSDVDWMEAGTKTVTYTLSDDYGNTLQQEYSFYVSEIINTDEQYNVTEEKEPSDTVKAEASLSEE